MDDVRTLAAQRRRRRQARRQVDFMLIRRSAEVGAVAFVELAAAAVDAMESAQWAVAAFDVQVMWERACAAPR